METIKVFYDKDCNMCSNFVNYFNKINGIEFHSNKELLIYKNSDQVNTEQIINSSIVVISNKDLLTKSSAIIYLLNKIPKFKFLSTILSLLPLFVLDFCYNFISKRRLWFFSKSKFCKINNSP